MLECNLSHQPDISAEIWTQPTHCECDYFVSDQVAESLFSLLPGHNSSHLFISSLFPLALQKKEIKKTKLNECAPSEDPCQEHRLASYKWKTSEGREQSPHQALTQCSWTTTPKSWLRYGSQSSTVVTILRHTSTTQLVTRELRLKLSLLLVIYESSPNSMFMHYVHQCQYYWTQGQGSDLE